MSTGGTTAPATVLVIDDDADTVAVIRGHLTRAGYRVLTARDGGSGLTMARAGVDLITLDMVMRPLDGRAVLQRLRAEPATADIPVVLVTVVDDVPPGMRADGRVSKPFRGGRLLSEVARLLPDGRRP